MKYYIYSALIVSAIILIGAGVVYGVAYLFDWTTWKSWLVCTMSALILSLVHKLAMALKEDETEVPPNP